MVFEDQFDRAYINILCSRPEDTCCMVCLDKPKAHKFFHDLIKVIKKFIAGLRQGPLRMV